MIRLEFKITPVRKRKLTILSKRVGCPLNWKRASGIAWNGQNVACLATDVSSILHDIAHYAMATKEARKAPAFGLGQGPDSMVNGEYKILYHYRVCQKIEEKASALGIYW